MKHSRLFLTLIAGAIAQFVTPVWAGELPPVEMKYPNVVIPAYQFGTFGNKVGEFNNMRGLAVTSSNTLIIADTYNMRVQELAIDGRPIRMWDLSSSGDGSRIAMMPISATLIEDGSLAVLDGRSNMIVKFNATGEQLKYLEKSSLLGLKSPMAMRYRNGRFFIADSGNDRIVIADDEGAFIRAFGRFGPDEGEFRKPSDVAIDEDGQIYVTDSDNNRIQKFSADGEFLKAWGEWGSYSGMLATPISLYYHGNSLYVADLVNHRIQVFDKNGQFKFQFGRHPPQSHEGNGRVHYPTSVAVTDDGMHTIVCEPFEHRCQVFNEFKLAKVKVVDDSAWWDKATKFHYGTGSESTKNSLTITEPDTHATLLFDIRERDPRYITSIGTRGTSPGEFIRPSGSHLDEELGRLYISDSGNRRIQVFDISLEDAFSENSSWDGVTFSHLIDLSDGNLNKKLRTEGQSAASHAGLGSQHGSLPEPRSC